MRQRKSQPSITPMAIAQAAVEHQRDLKAVTSLAISAIAKHPLKKNKFYLTRSLASHRTDSIGSPAQKIRLTYPFLKYALEYWLVHSKHFNVENLDIWALFKQLLLDEHGLGQTPWTQTQFDDRDHIVWEWICREHHAALLRFIEYSEKPFRSSAEDKTENIHCEEG